MDHVLLSIHLLTDTGVVNRPWSCCYLSFIVENAAVNIDLHTKKPILVPAFSSFEHISRSENSRAYVHSVFNFLKNS